MPNDDELDLDKMTVAASALGWPKPGRWPEVFEWPESFDRDGQTWELEHITPAADGEIQTAEYTAGPKLFLIVYNE